MANIWIWRQCEASLIEIYKNLHSVHFSVLYRAGLRWSSTCGSPGRASYKDAATNIHQYTYISAAATDHTDTHARAHLYAYPHPRHGDANSHIHSCPTGYPSPHIDTNAGAAITQPYTLARAN